MRAARWGNVRRHRDRRGLIAAALAATLVLFGGGWPRTDPIAGAAPATWPDAHEANAAIGRGVEIVTELDAVPGSEFIDVEVAADVAVAGGFRSVRLPVPFTRYLEPDGTVDPAFLAAVEDELAVLTDHGLTVVVSCICTIESIDAFHALWAQLAPALADQPPSVYFELANEPVWHGTDSPVIPDFGADNILHAADWNQAVATVLPTVRASNPERIVVVTGPDLSFPQAVPDLVLPDDDRHLIVTFHQYQPLQFTHQGAGWLPGSDAWLGTTWSGTAAEIDTLAGTMEAAVCWAAQHDRPLFLGEFGSLATGDLASRVAWTETVARMAEAEGISWTYFELSSDGFGIWDRHVGAWRTELYEALLPPVDDPMAPWAACAGTPTTTAPAGTASTTPAAAATVTPTFTG